jgi:hypothetical protein
VFNQPVAREIVQAFPQYLAFRRYDIPYRVAGSRNYYKHSAIGRSYSIRGRDEVGRRIEITLIDTGVRAIAGLYDEAAPMTCSRMWRCLETPMETAGIQAMWLGRELMFIMPKANQKGDPTLRSRAAVELNTMAYP